MQTARTAEERFESWVLALILNGYERDEAERIVADVRRQEQELEAEAA